MRSFGVLLLLSTVFIQIHGFREPNKDEFIKQSFEVRVVEARGHRTFLEIDSNGQGKKVYAQIAFITLPGAIAFAKYQPVMDGDNICQTFIIAGSGPERHCNFFSLLREDFYRMQRRPWGEYYSNPSGCPHRVEKNQHYLVGIKENVADPNSPKFIGTYDEAADVLTYFDEIKNKEEMIEGVKDLDTTKYNRDQKLEFFCKNSY